MKKILMFLLVFCAVFAIFSPISVASAEDETYIVTANSASIFAEPDFSSEKLGTLKHKDAVKLKFENGSLVVAGEKWKFYELKNGGYIFCDLVTKQTKIITQIPNFNAKTNSSCDVFLQEDLNLVKSDIHLKKGERIFLYQGYNRKSSYTAVAFLFENEVVYGYVKTSVVSPDGINPLIITCGVVILAVLGIVFTWVFMKRKRAK